MTSYIIIRLLQSIFTSVKQYLWLLAFCSLIYLWKQVFIEEAFLF